LQHREAPELRHQSSRTTLYRAGITSVVLQVLFHAAEPASEK
jgi:hypothetical protein